MPRLSNFADQEEQPSKDLTVPQTHSAPGRIAHIVLELITGDPDKFMLTVDGIILRVKGAVQVFEMPEDLWSGLFWV